MSISPRAYSADVRLHLAVNGQVTSLSQVGPDSVILETACELPPCSAEVIVKVDGREHRRKVLLPDGASRASRWVKITGFGEHSTGTVS